MTHIEWSLRKNNRIYRAAKNYLEVVGLTELNAVNVANFLRGDDGPIVDPNPEEEPPITPERDWCIT